MTYPEAVKSIELKYRLHVICKTELIRTMTRLREIKAGCYHTAEVLIPRHYKSLLYAVWS